MEYKTLGIIAIIVFATTSAFMADGDDVLTDATSGYEYADDEWSDFDTDEFFDDDDIEYVTTTEVSEKAVMPRGVVARMTCDEINKQIAELREDVKSYPELQSELDSMIGRQRAQCATTTNRRPVHNYNNINPVHVVDVPEPEPEPEVVAQPEPEQVPEPEKNPEELAAEEEAKNAQIIENLSKGLCGDGMQPNRYGCCEGEVFKEVKPMVFGCCPKDGNGQCLEPIK